MVLAKEHYVSQFYTIKNVKQHCDSFAGVLASNELLQDFFLKENIHQNVHLFSSSC